MKIISFKRREDYGTDLYAQILYNRHWALFQGSVSWNDYAAWPYIQIKSGNGSTLSIMLWAYKFGLDVGIIERTWNWDRIDQYLEDHEAEEDPQQPYD